MLVIISLNGVRVIPHGHGLTWNDRLCFVPITESIVAVHLGLEDAVCQPPSQDKLVYLSVDILGYACYTSQSFESSTCR